MDTSFLDKLREEAAREREKKGAEKAAEARKEAKDREESYQKKHESDRPFQPLNPDIATKNPDYDPKPVVQWKEIPAKVVPYSVSPWLIAGAFAGVVGVFILILMFI